MQIVAMLPNVLVASLQTDLPVLPNVQPLNIWVGVKFHATSNLSTHVVIGRLSVLTSLNKT